MTFGGFGAATIAAVRARVDSLLTDRCDIHRRTFSVSAVGENTEVFQLVQEDVPCRFMTSLLDTRVALETIGGVAVTDVERYRVAFSHGTNIPSAGRLIRDGEVFEIVNIRENKADDAQVMVFVTRVRE